MSVIVPCAVSKYGPILPKFKIRSWFRKINPLSSEHTRFFHFSRGFKANFFDLPAEKVLEDKLCSERYYLGSRLCNLRLAYTKMLDLELGEKSKPLSSSDMDNLIHLAQRFVAKANNSVKQIARDSQYVQDFARLLALVKHPKFVADPSAIAVFEILGNYDKGYQFWQFAMYTYWGDANGCPVEQKEIKTVNLAPDDRIWGYPGIGPEQLQTFSAIIQSERLWNENNYYLYTSIAQALLCLEKTCPQAGEVKHELMVRAAKDMLFWNNWEVIFHILDKENGLSHQSIIHSNWSASATLAKQAHSPQLSQYTRARNAISLLADFDQWERGGKMDEDRINHLIQSGKEKEVVKLAMLYAIGHSDRAKMKDLPLSSESMEKICRHVDIHKLAASVELLNFQKAHTAMNWGKYIPPKAA